MSDFSWLVWPDHCTAEVSRDGELQPCDQTAVAVALDEGSEYPVCKNHSRGRDMLELGRIIERARGYDGAAL